MWLNAPKQEQPARGNTLEEAIENLKEATELYLEEVGMLPYKRSVITTFNREGSKLCPRHPTPKNPDSKL